MIKLGLPGKDKLVIFTYENVPFTNLIYDF